MSEQQPSSQVKTLVDAQQETQLEGIRAKVFLDRYSLKDPHGKPLELTPEQLWARVARGIAGVETTDEQRTYWEKRFYEALTNFQFVPGGRILAGAGSGHQVTFYNCFSAETLVHTKAGLEPIGTLQGDHEVLSAGGVYRKAHFQSYGKQQLWAVTLANDTIIYATADHQWVVNKEKGGNERVTTRELIGRRIPINARPAPAYDEDFSKGVRHGIVFGDGSIQYGRAHVCLFGEKEQLADWFSSYRQKESGGTVATKEHVRIDALPAEWKQLPARDAAPAYWRGFVAGLIATDGHVDTRGSVAMYHHDRNVLFQIAEGMAIAGFVASTITMTRELSPYDGSDKPVYRLQLFKSTVNERDILHAQHRENFRNSPEARQSSIRVTAVEETDRYEEVFCCVEPETHTITIGHGYLTGQCYVIPSPEDSRQGILDNLKVMTEIMARGGGVGINLSTLRPRGSYIKTVNGTASGPCSWAQLYSVATGDVIQQGGCFGPNERIATDHGLIPAKELADRLEVGEKIKAQTHKGLRPFTYVFRNGVKELSEVTTTHGYHVQVTLDHKMAILRDDAIVTIPLRELAEGNEVLLLLGEGRKAEIHPDTIASITPSGLAEVFDFEVEEVHLLSGGGIYTSNSRRGALMLMLDDTHPDIEEFITVKRTPGKIEHANLSVCISDKFMQAVKDEADWDLIWQGEVKKTIRARELWDLICTSAWESAEPGMVFMDRCNKLSNTWYYENIRCVNPCGEQPLPPYGVCNLGALNLSSFVQNGQMDYERLAEASKTAMRFLDNVIDANEYFIEENREAQLGTRRTGLGTMGLADALIKMQVPYGSEASVAVIERIYTTIRDAAYEASADIAAEKGSFPHFERDKYMKGQFIQRLPRSIQEKIRKQGIRNAVLLTQAPTGTTSLFAGVSSGIEPVYDFAMVRRDRTGEHIMYHPLLQEWKDKHPDESTPGYFVASNDLTPEEHVRVQAAIQRYTDSSISKTVNAPNNHTVEQVQTLYRLAYEMGCKGVTYYRDGSRDAVLTRVEDEKKKQEQQVSTMPSVASIHDGIKPRPPVVQGYTRQVSAPEGKANVTINSDESGPLEVFINVGKAGSDIAALAEALGRLISLNLRLHSPVSQAERAREIADQLRGIGGSRSVGFGIQQVRSLPDAVARALELHLESLEAEQSAKEGKGEETNTSLAIYSDAGANGSVTHDDPPSALNLTHMTVTGNLCPSCGCNTLVREEGCKKCYNCGYSEC